MSDDDIDGESWRGVPSSDDLAARFVQMLERPLESIDWKEFHFFRRGMGLSKAKANLPGIQMCLDYELARESKGVADFIASLGKDEKTELINGALLMQLRHVMITKKPSIDTAFSLIVPTVSVAAPWFPAPWLSATVQARVRLARRLGTLYGRHYLPYWAFPVGRTQAREITRVAIQRRQRLVVVSFDGTQSVTALMRAFGETLRRIGVGRDSSNRGKIKLVSALEDLGCYRLARLRDRARASAMNAVGFSRSANKISDGKRRTTKRLRGLRYI